MGTGILQEPKGEKHVWMILRAKDGYLWKCCECEEVSEEDLPPSHGCKEKGNGD